MALVKCICPECGEEIEVDTDEERVACAECDEDFLVSDLLEHCIEDTENPKPTSKAKASKTKKSTAKSSKPKSTRDYEVEYLDNDIKLIHLEQSKDVQKYVDKAFDYARLDDLDEAYFQMKKAIKIEPTNAYLRFYAACFDTDYCGEYKKNVKAYIKCVTKEEKAIFDKEFDLHDDYTLQEYLVCMRRGNNSIERYLDYYSYSNRKEGIQDIFRYYELAYILAKNLISGKDYDGIHRGYSGHYDVVFDALIGILMPKGNTDETIERLSDLKAEFINEVLDNTSKEDMIAKVKDNCKGNIDTYTLFGNVLEIIHNNIKNGKGLIRELYKAAMMVAPDEYKVKMHDYITSNINLVKDGTMHVVDTNYLLDGEFKDGVLDIRRPGITYFYMECLCFDDIRIMPKVTTFVIHEDQKYRCDHNSVDTIIVDAPCVLYTDIQCLANKKIILTEKVEKIVENTDTACYFNYKKSPIVVLHHRIPLPRYYQGPYLYSIMYVLKGVLHYSGELNRDEVRARCDECFEEEQKVKKIRLSTRGSSGCYIATSVYGSYDCPEVWTLRRYRDNTLDSTFFGRLFIKLYYAISPTMVKLFGNKKWFKSFFRKRLDKMVAKLKEKGVEDTPYNDKY